MLIIATGTEFEAIK